MTIKVTYNVTDVYVTQDVSPVYINVSYSGGGGGAAVWGTITGTLSNQTDLQTALDGKFDDPTGTTSQYLRGDGSLATFPSLTGFVPYTGATQAVNLGAYDLTVNSLTIGKGNNSLVNNTALGHSTLLTITTGNFNTAVGYESLRNTTTGQYNTAIGQSSLFSNTTGGQNTALGLNALLYNTSGASNVAVGLDGLMHITTGSSNTAIGYNAGSHITGGSTPNTTATNSVFIGRDSKAAADGQTNQIVIGQNAVGNGSNTATFGNTATTANYFTGSINGGSFVKSGGISSQFLKADGSVDSTTYIGGSGASGQVAYWTGTSAQSGSNNFTWNNNNGRLDINAITTVANHRVGLAITSAAITRAYFNSSATGGDWNTGFAFTASNVEKWSMAGFGSTFDFTIFNGGLNARAITFKGNTNNALIGTDSDSGERLQVTGTSVIKDITTSSVASALLQLSSTTKGFLPPRMTTTQKNAISSPAAGLVVYDTTLNKICVYTTAWETITSV
jgi:hypothetical protein